MLSSETFASVERCLTNRLEPGRATARLAAVIGDAPSQYSKSPRLWNAAFQLLEIDAAYLAFDVDDARLGDLLSALRACEQFLGANVTVPHKVRVMDFLDAVDPGAQRIRAVNTIVREPDGRLIGYNTDGEGFIESLRAPSIEDGNSFVPSLRGMTVIVLGAGGSARAVAFHVAEETAGGKLLICNRTIAHAEELAKEIVAAGGRAAAISEEELAACALEAGLIVNCTTKGQGGIRKLAGGQATLLEPYSALAPAHPPAFSANAFGAGFEREWLKAAGNDIDANQHASMQIAKAVPIATRFYDLIYHPEETVFLRHGRASGHRTLNGKPMIVHQAAIALHKRICARELGAKGLDTPQTRADIVRAMYAAW